MQAAQVSSGMIQGPARGRGAWLVALGCALGTTLGASRASAQASSDCYFDKMRMVDAAPLAGQKHSTDEVTGTFHYLLSLPKGHDKTKKWPVIVFMHGIGEVNAQGANLNGLTKHSLPRMVEDPLFDYPFIVVSPQVDNGGWVNHAADIGAVFDRLETEFGGDPNRLYLTGLSYGGVGTYAVGIALADRIAALMPVTPGGSVANWDMRSKIVNLPIWLFMGKLDNEYNANAQRVTELEASGAEPFFKYDHAFADEYKDVAPQEALTHKHVYGSYDNIGHDVWHATYGVYCPTLDAQKTVQYDWLLSQSKDGTPFVDPRDPIAGVGGSGGVSAGGAAGAASTGGVPATGGMPGSLAGSAMGGGSATAGTGTSAGGSGNTGVTPVGSSADDSGSCSIGHGDAGSGAWALLLAGAALLRRKRQGR